MKTSIVAPGTVIGERFVVEKLAGSGGMSSVYRSYDRRTEQTVAVKILQLRTQLPQEVARFLRESQLLSELSHPAIVRYIDHGQTDSGLPYLAMEWLDGEDLASRLLRGPLSIRQSVRLMERLTSALEVAHDRGIIHRDIKPNNLFLRGGQLDGVTLLDFGVARHGLASRGMTQTGTVVGTPEYMSPEQARGRRDITPAADIFSLGCVLYECLTGQPPFLGEHVASLLGRILFEEAPRLSTAWRNVSPQLDELVRTMLNRDPKLRPASAAALRRALQEIPPCDEEVSVSPLPANPSGITEEEQQLVSVLMAAEPHLEPEGVAAGGGVSSRGVTLDRETLLTRLSSYSAQVEWLADGSLCAILRGLNSARDLAVSAARVALILRELWPSAVVILCTGRSILREQFPIGEAIERAVKMLRRQQTRFATLSESGPAEDVRGIYVDDLSAEFLDGRFVLSDRKEGRTLLSETASSDESRPLLGKPTPCLGREQDLAVVDLALATTLEQHRPQAVLITALPGIGKSRLRHEFLRRQELRGQPLSVLLGRGDPLTIGSPYAALAQALRHSCGFSAGDSGDAARAKLQEHLAGLLRFEDNGIPGSAAASQHRVSGFLGELMGIRFGDDHSVQLRVARSDPKIMSDQVAQAFLDYLGAISRPKPLVLVLEDVQWIDAQSLKLVEVALRELQGPLLVLALGRPEVREAYPQLWAGCVQELRLAGLGRRAAERLVRQILGPSFSASLVTQLVNQADGNALYLEELIRAVSAGKQDTLPETIVAMLQARLQGIDTGARRVLRSASVFGETFWYGGVQALQTVPLSDSELERHLQTLIEAELIVLHRDSRWPGEREYAFRHALIRDATYGLLTLEDRVNGHFLAARYLERVGEPDPMVHAEHLRLGGQPDLAVAYYIQAAEQALAGNDLPATLDRVELGKSCGASGDALGTLSALACTAHFWRDDFQSAYPAGCQALELLPRGSRRWMQSLGNMLTFTSLMGKQDHFRALVGEYSVVSPSPEALGAYVEAGSLLISMFSFGGVREAAQGFLGLVQGIAGSLMQTDPLARSWWQQAGAIFHLMLGAQPQLAVNSARDGLQAARDAGSRRSQVLISAFLGMSLAAAGDHTSAESVLRDNLHQAQRLAEPLSISHAKVWLAMGLCWRGDGAMQQEAAKLAGEVLATPGANAFYILAAQCVQAMAGLSRGDLAAADAAFAAGAALHPYLPILHAVALSTQLAVLRQRGTPTEAVSLLETARALHTRVQPMGFADPALRRELALWPAPTSP
jgi:serine/threonine protein kinase